MSVGLSAHRLTVIRGDRCLFRDLSFAVNSGELLLLQGENGSGKTTLLRAIAGLLPLESGELNWNGAEIAGDRQRFRASLVWLAHRTGLKADLTLVENLRFEASLRPQTQQESAAVFDRLGLSRLTSLPLRSLSAGQQRRVALARLLLADAPLWLMDEPFTNLDRGGRSLVSDIVSEHLAAGGICIMAAHQDVAVDATVQRVTL